MHRICPQNKLKHIYIYIYTKDFAKERYNNYAI